jgi:hypothetical protein
VSVGREQEESVLIGRGGRNYLISFLFEFYRNGLYVERRNEMITKNMLLFLC